MIVGVISDTHTDKANALPHIMRRFKEAGVKLIVHCGDLDPRHLDAELFLGLPVLCALTEEQENTSEFEGQPPPRWTFTRPGSVKNRIATFGHWKIYLGHRRSFDFLMGSEAELKKTLSTIRKDHDRVSWLFSGHTHHQIFCQDKLISFLNPGAVENSFDGYEFAIIDTETGRVIFSRIPAAKPAKTSFKVGVISDSLNITELDTTFWLQLAEIMKKAGVNNIIHCGNIALTDVGRPELKDFQVYYFLRQDQTDEHKLRHDNWHLVAQGNPVVEIEGYKFCIQLDIGLLDRSELDMSRLTSGLQSKYPEIRFVLCGCDYNAFLEEGERVRIINPGDIIGNRNYVIIELPTTEIVFDHIPAEPLAPPA